MSYGYEIVLYLDAIVRVEAIDRPVDTTLHSKFYVQYEPAHFG